MDWISAALLRLPRADLRGNAVVLLQPLSADLVDLTPSMVLLAGVAALLAPWGSSSVVVVLVYRHEESHREDDRQKALRGEFPPGGVPSRWQPPRDPTAMTIARMIPVAEAIAR